MPKRFLLVALLLSACSSLEDPGYSQPNQEEAKNAYISGRMMIADLLEGRPVVQASLFPVEAVRKVIDIKSMIKEFQIEGGILSLRSNSGIDKVSISDCHWQRVDPDDLDKIAQPLVGENPPGGYFCKVDVFVTQNYGIKAKAMTEGYFFKDANQKWMYLGKDAHGFERY